MADKRPYLWLWILAVWHHWLVLISGGLTTLGSWLWATYGSGVIYPSALTFVLGIGMVLWAFYSAWCDEFVKRETVQAEFNKIADQNRKELKAEIVQIIVAGNDEALDLLITMSLRNIGAPTAVDGWRLEVVNTDYAGVYSVLEIPDQLHIDAPGSKIAGTLVREHAIYEKTLNPLARGQIIQGWIRFQLPIPFNRVSDIVGMRVLVACEDVEKQLYCSNEQTITSTGGDLFYTVGTGPQIRPKPIK